MSPVPAILPSPPLTNCNCFDSYKREAANRQRLLVDDNPTRWERFWYRLLEDTRKYSRLDSMGYFQIDHRLLIMYQASLRRCWHTDPEWIKRKHWDRSAPWCWNLRNWYGIEPCEHWAWRRPKNDEKPNGEPLGRLVGNTLVMCRACGSGGDIICAHADGTMRALIPHN